MVRKPMLSAAVLMPSMLTPLPPDEALLPECLQRVVLAIVLGHHPQAGGAAIHGVELPVIWKLPTHY